MAPFRRPARGATCVPLLGIAALLSGIASHVTSGALSQSPSRARVVDQLSPLVTTTTPPASPDGVLATPPAPERGLGREGGDAGAEGGEEAAEGRRPPPILSDSILDMIDTEEVGRVLAKKKRKEGEGGGRRRAPQGGPGTHGRGRGYAEPPDESRGPRKGKGDPRKLQRGPKRTQKAGRKDGSESRHRVSLSRLPKWLDISPLESYPVPNSPIPVFPEPMPPVRDGNREKILRSSKDALVVTRREYLRRDWCRTEPLIQRVKVDGCLTRSIVNGFCYGQCNSFYIPRSPRELPSSNTSLTMSSGHAFIRNNLGPLTVIPILYTQAFMSCAFCKPKEVTWVTISLRCPAIKPAQLTLRRRVERIKQCKCISEMLN